MNQHRITVWPAAALLVAACASAPAPATEQRSQAGMTELASLMKNHINPSFSRLTFLVFHGEELQENPLKVRTEMQQTVGVLRRAVGELRDWRELQTQSVQGRDVFNTFATNVDRQAQQLFDAIEHRDADGAEKQMQDIAETCNNCHHFFRLKLEDSVVPSR